MYHGKDTIPGSVFVWLDWSQMVGSARCPHLLIHLCERYVTLICTYQVFGSGWVLPGFGSNLCDSRTKSNNIYVLWSIGV